jgi:ABC-type multidrug transport system ATPase subunit
MALYADTLSLINSVALNTAVDSHVGQHLFKHALQGALAGKTRILVTHALHFLPHVDCIITIDEGHVVEQGTYTELMERDGAFAALVKEFGTQENEKKEEHEDEEKKALEEEVEKKEKEVVPKKAQKLMQGKLPGLRIFAARETDADELALCF